MSTYAAILVLRIFLFKDTLFNVRVVGDMGCERIHKEKKVERVEFLFTRQERRGHGVERYTSIEGWGLGAFIEL